MWLLVLVVVIVIVVVGPEESVKGATKVLMLVHDYFMEFLDWVGQFF